ncbi:MAG: hypothetical protein ACI837_002899, partial [Crocinitomicaceae bacterium]
DDLTLGSGLGDSIRFYQNTGTIFTQVDLGIAGLEHTKQISWIDYDNDGDMDLFIANLEADNVLYRNDGGLSFTDVTIASGLSLEGTPTWAFDWGDYNRDGWLDLYVTNNTFGTPYDTIFSNYLYKNNADGTFDEMTRYAAVADSNKSPLAVIFTDINNDMWPDIFVPTDKMLGNVLFKNTMIGGFEDISVSSNANQTICSMNAGAGDCNNNGYLDLYVTNSPPGNVFLENNGNETFAEVGLTNGTGFFQESWGGVFFDADNDTDQDLYVSGGVGDPAFNSAAMYENDGTGMYTELTSGIGMDADTTRSYANAYADFNSDGFMDLVVNNVGPDSSQIWMNNGNGNSYVQVLLHGTLSNSHAIGGVVEIYHGGTYQKRYNQCANGFMNQNSTYLHYGLGASALIDSLIISWPSGMIESYYSIPVNQRLEYTEGAQTPFIATVFSEGPLTSCASDPVTLHPNGQFTDVVWNNTIASRTLLVTTSGTYFYEAVDPNSAMVYSDSVQIIINSNPVSSITTTDVSCYGGANGTAISTTPGSENIVGYMWSNSTPTPATINLMAGNYTLIETDINGCTDTVNFMITQPDSIEIASTVTSNDCYDGAEGEITIMVTGGTPNYMYLWNTSESTNVITGLSAGSYLVQVTDSNNCVQNGIYTITEPMQISSIAVVTDEVTLANGSIDLTPVGGTAPYTFLWDNAMITEDITGLSSGLYSCTITDSLNCSVVVTYFVGSQVGLSENGSAIVSVSPNPSDGIFTLKMNELDTDATISVIDIHGKIIRGAFKINATTQIDLSGEAAGVYLLKIATDDHYWTVRLMKH